MNNNKDVESLGTGPVGKLFFRLAIPAICSHLIILVKSLLSRLYVGHIADCGGESLTAIGVALPIILLSSAIGTIIAGGAPLMSIFLGKQETDKAHRVVGSSVTFLFIASSIFVIFARIFSENILCAAGASSTILPYAKAYFNIAVFGFLPTNLLIGLSNSLTGQGLVRRVMRLMMLSVIGDVVLAPIFIFALNMGVRGAAWAEVISIIPAAILLLRELIRKDNAITLEWKHLVPDWKLLGSVLALGFSPFFSFICDAVVSGLYNRSLAEFGGDHAVGAMSIFTLIYMIFYNLFLGLATGMMPIITYSFGQENTSRVQQCIRLLYRSSFIVSFLLWAVLMIFPSAITQIFTNDTELAAYASQYICRYFMCSCLLGLFLAGNNIIRFLRQVKLAISLVVFQKLLLTIPLILLLPRLGSADPIAAIFTTGPIVDVLATLVATLLVLYVIRKLKTKKI